MPLQPIRSAFFFARRGLRAVAQPFALAGLVGGLGSACLLPAHAEQMPARTAATPQNVARVIVKYRTDTRSQALSAGSTAVANEQRAQVLGQRLGLPLTDGLTLAPRMQVLQATGLTSQALATQLAADSDVEWAEPDLKMRAQAAPSDPLYLGGSGYSPVVGQWYLQTASSSLVSAINAETAWGLNAGSAAVIVAVLDTGVRKDHPDLSGKLVEGRDFVSEDSSNVFTTANDGDGWDADPSDPGDWVSTAENSSGVLKGCGVSSSSWHGTQTAGLVGASTNNAVGMASIGRNVMVQPVRVMGKCGGYQSDIIAGMRWAAGLSVSGVSVNPTPAKVLNMSLGSASTCSTAYAEAVSAVRAAGVSVVASAGNDSLATNMPANCSGAIAVAGVRHIGTKIGYSSLGSAVTISAPGGNCVNDTGECLYPILSTSNTGSTSPGGHTYTTGGSDYAVGTSFSAPLVAGTVGLMLSANPKLTPTQITSLLKSSARAFPTSGAGTGVSSCSTPGTTAQLECYCTTTTCGAGMLDAGAAVVAAAAIATTSAVITPSTYSMTVGSPVTLSASQSVATNGAQLVGYAWSLSGGTSSVAALSGDTSSSSVILTPLASGSVTVVLTVTDSNGTSDTTSHAYTLGTATDSGSTTTENGGGDGGGALPLGWGLALATGVLALAHTRRRNGSESADTRH